MLLDQVVMVIFSILWFCQFPQYFSVVFSSLVLNMWRYLDGVPSSKKEKHDNEGTNVNTQIKKKHMTVPQG